MHTHLQLPFADEEDIEVILGELDNEWLAARLPTQWTGGDTVSVSNKESVFICRIYGRNKAFRKFIIWQGLVQNVRPVLKARHSWGCCNKKYSLSKSVVISVPR